MTDMLDCLTCDFRSIRHVEERCLSAAEVVGAGGRGGDGDVIVDLDLSDDSSGAELSDRGAVTFGHMERELPRAVLPWQRLSEAARG